MTTKEDDTARAKQEDDDKRKAAAKQDKSARTGDGDEDRGPTSITEFDYDPMEDPTFNKNEAQQYAEPGHAGSEDAS
jgi:hypothetical protein